MKLSLTLWFVTDTKLHAAAVVVVVVDVAAAAAVVVVVVVAAAVVVVVVVPVVVDVAAAADISLASLIFFSKEKGKFLAKLYLSKIPF